MRFASEAKTERELEAGEVVRVDHDWRCNRCFDVEHLNARAYVSRHCCHFDHGSAPIVRVAGLVGCTWAFAFEPIGRAAE
jgi:hypothetical protein